MSNVSISHIVFYPFGELSVIFIKFQNCRLQTLSEWKSLKFVIWERIKAVDCLTHSHTMAPFDVPGKRAISPFPTVFSTHLDNFLPFSSNLKLSSANSFSLEESKICRLVMGKYSSL